jgi:hypothetical protein
MMHTRILMQFTHRLSKHTHTHTHTHTGTAHLHILSFEEGSEPNGGILGTMMPNAFYNDQPIPEADKGFLFSYNKLIGGVLITQVCLCACVLLLVHWCESALACHNVYSTHPCLPWMPRTGM